MTYFRLGVINMDMYSEYANLTDEALNEKV